jgi:class 3 adenylate cyclase
MPLFMDIHKVEGTTSDAVAKAHLEDLKVQEKYGVKYLRYWFNERAGHIFCLVEAPDAAAATAVHREAHGLLAEQIIEVEAGTVGGFLGDGEERHGAAGGSALDTGVRTILFTDIEGWTTITQRLGDAEAHKLLRTHDAILRDAISSRGGREVKQTGDGFMAVFRSASAAVECAIAIQRALAGYNQTHPEQPIRVRAGLSAGEPVEDHADLFGASVHLAARACEQARPEQILASNVVAELCIGKPFVFVDQGERVLKGFEKPVRLHEVRWRSEG